MFGQLTIRFKYSELNFNFYQFRSIYLPSFHNSTVHVSNNLYRASPIDPGEVMRAEMNSGGHPSSTLSLTLISPIDSEEVMGAEMNSGDHPFSTLSLTLITELLWLPLSE